MSLVPNQQVLDAIPGPATGFFFGAKVSMWTVCLLMILGSCTEQLDIK